MHFEAQFALVEPLFELGYFALQRDGFVQFERHVHHFDDLNFKIFIASQQQDEAIFLKTSAVSVYEGICFF